MSWLLASLFDTSPFPARWHCGRWSEGLGWLHIVSDVAVFGAYMAIPIALLFFARHRRDLPKPFPFVFWMFGAFILACGCGHLVEAIIFWHPIYRAAGVIKGFTAAVSWATVACLIPAVPKALALRGPAVLQHQVEVATAELRRQRDAAAHLATIVESSHDAIFSQSLDGEIRSWNPGAERMFGYTQARIGELGLAALLPEAQRPLVLDALARARRGEATDELDVPLLRQDASEIAVSLAIAPYFDESHQIAGLSLIARDITQRRRADALFHTAVEASPSGMIAVDASGKITLANAEAVRLFGYSRDELLGLTIEALVPERTRAAHPQLRANYARSATARAMGAGRQLLAKRKDGSEFPVDVGLTPIDVNGETLTLSAIVDRTEVKREHDALESKTAELERSNEELEQFAYVASHDLQEPLRMVVNFMNLLEKDYAPTLDETARHYVHFAVDGAQRMKTLIDALLTYSRIDTRGNTFEPVELTQVLDNVLKNLALLISESGAVVSHDPLPSVRADAQQIEQLLQNLIANALKFRGDSPPRIRISAIDRAAEVEVCVQDNGIGFDGRQAERIFQMFQRLHERTSYPGSGIGLAVAKRIVGRHGGKIWADSEPGRGATFHFTVPRQVRGRAAAWSQTC
jgi:PAS domain S-box-containing protein